MIPNASLADWFLRQTLWTDGLSFYFQPTVLVENAILRISKNTHVARNGCQSEVRDKKKIEWVIQRVVAKVSPPFPNLYTVVASLTSATKYQPAHPDTH